MNIESSFNISNKMDSVQCEEYYFSSNFDSGNLRRVELVRSCPDNTTAEHIIHTEFNVWTCPDCFGTPYESPNRTWFFFSIKGGRPHRNVRINVKNLNRQAKLFNQGMQPVMRIGENGKWERIKEKPTFLNEADNFSLSFFHHTQDKTNIEHYYAFTYPFTYTESQKMLERFDSKHGKTLQDVQFIINRLLSLERADKTFSQANNNCVKKQQCKDGSSIESNMTDTSVFTITNTDLCDDSLPSTFSEIYYDKFSKKDLLNQIYYHRELLMHSIENRRVDLLTITSFHGIQNEYEDRLSNIFPDNLTHRCHSFKDKKIVFVSSRVHPGETPASFVLNGFLNFILDRKSSVASILRQMYVFKIVPCLNPDGVYNGMYRTDTLGQNLNRMYICPRIDIHPSIYAVKKLIKYYHLGYDRFDEDNKMDTLQHAIINNKVDKMCSTPSIFELAESQMRSGGEVNNSDAPNEENDFPTPNCFSKETTSSEGEENTIVQRGNAEPQLQYRIFTDKLIPEIKTILNEPVAKKSTASTFGKKTVEHKGRKAGFKTVFGSSHTTNARNTENKYKDHSAIQNHKKNKKTPPKKEFKTNTIATKAINKKNYLSNHNINFSSEFSKLDYGSSEKGASEDKSNMFLYIDLHGHASKKGVFMYGNHFQNPSEAVECMLLPRIMGVNCHHFHYDACNFSERNMYRKEKRDGLSKEGSGRVAVYKMTGLIKSYTLESNYNTGRYVNVLPNKNKEVNNKINNAVPPKYTPAVFEEVGRSLGPSILDLTNSNNFSRIQNSEFRTLQGLRISLRNDIDRGVTQRPPASASSKVLSTHQNVERAKRNVLSATSTIAPNEVSKENKSVYPMVWDVAVASCSNTTSTLPHLQTVTQTKLPSKTSRPLKKNPLKARSTNLYGKKDVSITKKKTKIIMESCSTSKKDPTFQIPPKKVRVSPARNLPKESSSSSFKSVDTNSSDYSYKSIRTENSLRQFDPIIPPDTIIPSANVEESLDTHDLQLKTDKNPFNSLTSSISMPQFYSAEMSTVKKCSSESGLDKYGIISDTLNMPSTSASISSSKNSSIAEDVLPCTSRSLPLPIKKSLHTFRKVKKSDSYGGSSSISSSLGTKLLKKKRNVRHDSLIVKRKKSKVKMARH